jgi:hypothetical protein
MFMIAHIQISARIDRANRWLSLPRAKIGFELEFPNICMGSELIVVLSMNCAQAEVFVESCHTLVWMKTFSSQVTYRALAEHSESELIREDSLIQSIYADIIWECREVAKQASNPN